MSLYKLMNMDENKQNICSRCHKYLLEKNFKRLNHKGTGEPRLFKICNTCNLNKIKTNISILDNLVNNNFNIDVYNKKNE